MSYCSLAEAKAELRSAGTADDDQLLRYVRQVSARVDRVLYPRRIRPYFEPFVEAATLPLDTRNVRSGDVNAFFLDRPLLSLTSVSINGSDVTASVEAYPLGASPIRALRLTNGQSWYSYLTLPGPAYVIVTGVWGYHSDYAHAWLHVDDVTVAVVTPAALTFTVADADGDDPYGVAPRLSPGQVIRVGGGAELLHVSAVDAGTNALTVKRAHNGSSAPAGDYAVGDDVDVFQVEEPVRRVVARQAALLYSRQGSFEVQSLDGTGLTTYPQDLLTELARTLTDYMYV